MNIGEQINNLRKQHDLSQDDFANLFNVSRQTISNWENGKSYPDLEMIQRRAKRIDFKMRFGCQTFNVEGRRFLGITKLT